ACWPPRRRGAPPPPPMGAGAIAPRDQIAATQVAAPPSLPHATVGDENRREIQESAKRTSARTIPRAETARYGSASYRRKERIGSRWCRPFSPAAMMFG